MVAKSGETERLYFPHIEGLRAVAALLVAVYHIYLGRVSGGVDVFFVVSGFLITLSLLHKIDETGRLQWENFLTGLAMRLLPAAGLVLLLTVALTFLFLPEARYFETMREVLASFLYFENWQLALQAVDYLERENAQSPVQHYWAMSVQGQFYLIAVCAFLGSIWFARRLSRDAPHAVAAAFVMIFVLSLGYSIYQTHFGDQVWAYYDTFARVWEFCLGGLFGLAVYYRRSLALPTVFGWLGLLAIVLCGMIFQVGAVFPGAAALVPTLAAILVLLGGRSEARWSVGRVLGSSMFLSLGAVSYGIYLLHWPLLVVYREIAGVTTVSLVPGLLIILASIVGAYVIRIYVETPFLKLRREGLRVRGRAIAALGAPLLAVFIGLYAYHALPGKFAAGEELRFPGARALDGSAAWEIDADIGEFIPELATVKRDLPRSYRDGCHLGLSSDEIRWCVYGEEQNYARTIAVVGGSHSAQWLPALEEIVERNGWRILYSTWSACRFEVPGRNSRCDAIVSSVINELVNTKPDIVFTTANAGRGKEWVAGDQQQNFTAENVGRHESPPDGFLEAWRILQGEEIRVFALRDNPWLETDVPDCVSRESGVLQECGAERSKVLADNFDISMVPDNVRTADLSNFFCNNDYCPPVIGSILVYRDRHHITVPYALSISDELEAHLVQVMAEAEPVESHNAVHIQEVSQGLLSCGSTGRSAPIELEVEFRIGGGEVIVRRGSWKNRGSSFDVWRGQVLGSEVSVTGEYRDVARNPVRNVEFKGVYEDGELFLEGRRGPRECTFSAPGSFR